MQTGRAYGQTGREYTGTNIYGDWKVLGRKKDARISSGKERSAVGAEADMACHDCMGQVDLEKMKETDIDKKNNFLSMIQYFYKLAENKINIPELLNIFKVNSPGKSTEHDFDGFNPVYQWIKLLDDKTLNENFFEKIVNARP